MRQCSKPSEQLHRNFYEDTLDRAGVTMRLEQVASFVDSLDRLLPGVDQ
jgi:hypothetical protein